MSAQKPPQSQPKPQPQTSASAHSNSQQLLTPKYSIQQWESNVIQNVLNVTLDVRDLIFFVLRNLFYYL